MINRQPRREVNIPQLSGGLNLRDSLTGVRDNQLTDCVNMWYKDGALRTRPPFVTSMARLNKYENLDDAKNTKFHNEIKVFYKGLNCVVATNKCIYIDENGKTRWNIGFEFQAVDKIFVMPQISGVASGNDITYFCAEMGGVLYCYICDFSIWKLEYSKTVELGEDSPTWEKVTVEQRDVPIVYAHCHRSGFDDFKGTFFQGYNLIGNTYKMIYSAYNEADSDGTHPMRYKLGQDLASSGKITVDITTYDSENDKVVTVKHRIEYDEDVGKTIKDGAIVIESFENGKKPEDGLYLFAKYNYIGFLFKTDEPHTVAVLDTDERIKKYGCNEDNIVITAQYDVCENDLKKVFCMTQNIWFGGAANGINGGSRLFICGNTDNNEKSLVLWSGCNKPLYFGENCYAYVGSKSRAVTTFGRQGENLIVFKENKIYACYSQQDTNIDADSLIDQTVVDYEANSTYFPFVLINGFIGCDCPETVQMCRNRLVWTTSEGKVYTLCTMSQYNEHTVYEVSDMIAPRLKDYKNCLKTATSADFDGHYILFLDNCAFVMDYCSYGYQYVYSYSKSDDANTLIPWYFWDFSFLKNDHEKDIYKYACVCALDGRLILRAYFDAVSDGKTAFIGFAMDEKEYGSDDSIFCNDLNATFLQIKNNVINCSVTTKLFELGNGVYNINVDNVAVKIGSNNAADVIVRFITEQGEETKIINNKREHRGITDINFIRGKVLNPYIKNIVKFGLKFECDGQLCIDGLSVKYKLLGGVK